MRKQIKVQRAKCQLYAALLDLYDGDSVIDEADIRLMDVLVRDPDIQMVLQKALSQD